MNTFPRYDIQSTEVRGDKCTVTVHAATVCGPRIRAKATLKATRGERLQDLEAKTREVAARNLGYEHEELVARCIRTGGHKDHA